MSVYRWECDEDDDGTMLLRTDDAMPQQDAYVALYWYYANIGQWGWLTTEGKSGFLATADAARRACELAVLHGEREP